MQKLTHTECMYGHIKNLMRIFPHRDDEGYYKGKAIEIKRRRMTKDGLVITFEDGKKLLLRIEHV